MSIELDVGLIKYVEKFPYLYYKGAINYNNELLLANTWKKIGRDLKVSPEYCMNRWKYLRRRFTKEPQFSLPEKEWCLMKYMRFIEPFIHRRKPVDRLSEAFTVSGLNCNEYQSICSRAQWENCSSNFSNSTASSITEGRNSNSPDHHSASRSLEFTLWKQSNDSFCDSLSKTLQTLTADQQVRCRIDILVVIEKYMSSMFEDNSKSTNAVPNSFHSRLDTLATDMTKRFAEIPNKISNGSMTPFDEDWLLVFAVNNFFCKMLEMRKANAELDKMLPSFMSVDNSPQNSESRLQENGKQSDSAPRTSAEIKKPVCMNRKPEELKTICNNEVQSSSRLNPQLANSAPVEPCKIKTENYETQFSSTENAFQNLQAIPNSNDLKHISIKPALMKKIPESASTIQNTANNLIRIRPAANLRMPNFTTKLHVSNSPNNSLISTARSSEFENAVHEALKNLYSTNGFMKVDNRVLCVLCDVCLPTEQYKIAHTYDSNHKNFTKDYYLHSNRVKKTALPKLDSSLYIFRDGGLYCAKCRVLMMSRSNFLAHMKSVKHKNQVRNLRRYINFDVLENCSIGNEIVPIGTSNYCVLCDVKLFESSPITHTSSTSHKKEMALLEGVFKIDRFAYCSFCNETFPSTSLSIHVKNGKHAEKVLK